MEEWIYKHIGGVEFRPFDGKVTLSLRKGETVEAAVDRVRAEIAERQADLHRIASAPKTSVEAKAAIRREV